MAGPTPEFTDSFIVPTDNYGDFIRIVRQNVIKHCDDRRPNIVQPVLPREQTVPRLWFHVVLRNPTTSLTLAVRVDNLYLVGFKTTAGVWWEFNNEHGAHLIVGSRWLGFGAAAGTRTSSARRGWRPSRWVAPRWPPPSMSWRDMAPPPRHRRS
jgi:hypothetical protein